MLIAIPVDLLVMLLSITTSSLGIAILTSQNMAIALLLFIIGGFISGGLLVIQMLFRLNLTPIFHLTISGLHFSDCHRYRILH